MGILISRVSDEVSINNSSSIPALGSQSLGPHSSPSRDLSDSHQPTSCDNVELEARGRLRQDLLMNDKMCEWPNNNGGALSRSWHRWFFLLKKLSFSTEINSTRQVTIDDDDDTDGVADDGDNNDIFDDDHSDDNVDNDNDDNNHNDDDDGQS